MFTNDTLALLEHPDVNTHFNRYGYTPTRYVAIVFVVLFSISTLIHSAQAFRYRLAWPILTIILAGVMEIIGWGARLAASYNPESHATFLTQVIMLSIGPTPLLGSNFVIFGALVGILGRAYSRLRSKHYSIIFISCDVVAILVQGAGGGLAGSNDLDKSNLGAHILLGGIAFQLVVMTLYIAIAAEVLWRYYTDRPVRASSSRRLLTGYESNTRFMIYALALDTALLYIRALYRTIELAAGWHSKINRTEVWFNVFDGAMILLAFYTLNCAHPGRLLGERMDCWKRDDGDAEMKVMVREGEYEA